MRIVNVSGFEGLYVVREDGVIYSLKSGNELRPYLRKNGYLEVKLYKDYKKYTFCVHKIVYYSFVGQASLYSQDDLVIDHIDGNKLNNHISNLRKITSRENTGRAKETKNGRGVHYYKQIGKFGAEIMIEKQRYFLGTYFTAQEASYAYEIAMDRYEKKGIKPEKRRKQKQSI